MAKIEASLKTKVAVGLGFMIVSTVLLCFVILTLEREHLSTISKMLERVSVANHLATLTGEPNSGLPFEVEQYVLHPSDERKIRIYTRFQAIHAELAKLRALSRDSKNELNIRLLANMYATYQEMFFRLDANFKMHGLVVDVNSDVKQIKESSQLIRAFVQQVVSAQLSDDLASVTKLRQTERLQSSLELLAVLFGTWLIAFGFYKLFLKKMILSPLSRLQSVIATMAEDRGNLSVRAPVESDDEIGSLAEDFNDLADKLHSLTGNLEERVAQRTNELAESQQRLIQATKMSALGQMAGGVAHEINNPLAIIRLNSESMQMIAEDAGLELSSNKQMNEIGKTIEATVDRIAAIVKGLKTYSRDSSKDPFVKVPASSVAQDALALCSEKFKGSGVKLEFKDESQENRIACHPAEICQVLLNFLNNSFDALGSRGNISNNAKIVLEIVATSAGTRFTVRDNGPGIPEEIQSKVFDPFFTTKEVGQGTGLGLSISKGIVEKHGGQINCQSSEVGAAFAIDLPAA